MNHAFHHALSRLNQAANGPQEGRKTDTRTVRLDDLRQLLNDWNRLDDLTRLRHKNADRYAWQRDPKTRDGLEPGDHEEWCRLRHIDPVTGETFEAIKARELLAYPPAPRSSFVSTIDRVAFWIALAVTVAIWIFAGVKS